MWTSGNPHSVPCAHFALQYGQQQAVSWRAQAAWLECRVWWCANLKTPALTQMGPFRSTATLNVPAIRHLSVGGPRNGAS